MLATEAVQVLKRQDFMFFLTVGRCSYSVMQFSHRFLMKFDIFPRAKDRVLFLEDTEMNNSHISIWTRIIKAQRFLTSLKTTKNELKMKCVYLYQHLIISTLIWLWWSLILSYQVNKDIYSPAIHFYVLSRLSFIAEHEGKVIQQDSLYRFNDLTSYRSIEVFSFVVNISMNT